MSNLIRALFVRLLKSHANRSSQNRAVNRLPHRNGPRLESLEARMLLAADYSVIDTNPGSSGSLFDHTAVYGTDLYFLDTDVTYGAELRRLDTTSGQVSLVADINPGIGDSFAGRDSGLSLVGTKLYFSAYDPAHGYELRWIDVTAQAPTVHVLDILDGPQSSNPGTMGNLVAVGDKLYFSAIAQASGQSELCWIDTTSDTSVLNRTSFAMSRIERFYQSEDVSFTPLGDKLFFNGNDAANGQEPRWIDTVAAPSDVETIDLTPGISSSWTYFDFEGFKSVADKIFFHRNLYTAERELLWMDASSTSPTIHSLGILGIFAVQGNRLYTINDNLSLPGGTIKWLDASLPSPTINTIGVGGDTYLSNPDVLYVADSKMLVRTGPASEYTFCWIDLLASTPVIEPLVFSEAAGRAQDGYFNGPMVGYYGGFAHVDHKLYFTANDDWGVELRWIDTLSSNPTINTVDVSQHNQVPDVKNSYAGRHGGPVVIGDKLFFVADDANDQTFELPGTYKDAGKSNLRWIDTHNAPSDFNTIALTSSGDSWAGRMGGFLSLGSKLIFNVWNEGANKIITSSIDTTDSTVLANTIISNTNSRYDAQRIPYFYQHGFASFGTKVFFDSDGLLSLIDFSLASPTAQTISGSGTYEAGEYGGYTIAGNKLYYFASDSKNGMLKLRWIDVSESTPVVHSINVDGRIRDRYFYQPDNFLFASGDRLYFQGTDANGTGLKWIDTTSENPEVHSLDVSGAHLQDRVVEAGDRLYFIGDTSFWIDTTESNPTVHLIDVAEPAVNFIPKLVNNKIYFDAYDRQSGLVKLYWIDAATAAVNALPDVRINRDNYYIFDHERDFGVVGTKLFFDADSEGVGNQLRWIDTALAEPVVHTIALEANSNSQAAVLASDDSKVFFIASDSTYGKELRWIDTTDALLTIHTIDISSGPDSSFSQWNDIPTKIIANGRLYFSAAKTGLGYELVSIDLKNPPTHIHLSQTVFNEDAAVGETLATITSEDPDANETFAYALVAGEGDDDNDHFNIIGDKLILSLSLDYETKSSYSLRMRTTDSTNRSFEKSFVINVLDVAEGPVALSDIYHVPVNYFKEFNDATGLLTSDTFDNGVLANDSDPQGDTITAELVTPPMHGTLTFHSDGTFRYKPAANASVGQSESFTYRVTDSTGLSSEAIVTLNIGARIDSPFYNQSTHTDVSLGTTPGTTSPLDVLALINFLNANRGRSSIPVEELPQALPPAFYYDVNNDFFVSPLDVLAVVNFLNARRRGGEGEGAPIASGANSQAGLYDAAIVDLADIEKLKGRN